MSFDTVEFLKQQILQFSTGYEKEHTYISWGDLLQKLMLKQIDKNKQEKVRKITAGD